MLFAERSRTPSMDLRWFGAYEVVLKPLVRTGQIADIVLNGHAHATTSLPYPSETGNEGIESFSARRKNIRSMLPGFG